MSKRVAGKSKKASTTKSKVEAHKSRFIGAEDMGVMVGGNGDEVLPPELPLGDDPQPLPVYLNPETTEEREKRLAARKALTLRAFRTTYDNRHGRRKTS